MRMNGTTVPEIDPIIDLSLPNRSHNTAYHTDRRSQSLLQCTRPVHFTSLHILATLRHAYSHDIPYAPYYMDNIPIRSQQSTQINASCEVAAH